MSIRGSLPLLIYSGGVGLQGKYPIFGTIQYLAVHVDQCRARLDLMGWATSDGAAYVLSCGYRGPYPHTVPPKPIHLHHQLRLTSLSTLRTSAVPLPPPRCR